MRNPPLFQIASPGTEEHQTQITEVTLRDLFAAFAMAGSIVDGPAEREPVRLYDADQRQAIAANCYAMADAMLAAREKAS